MAYDQFLNDYFPRELDQDGAQKYIGFASLTPTATQFAQMVLVVPASAGKLVIVDEVRAYSAAGGVVKIGLYSTALTSLETDVPANRGAMDSRLGTGEATATVRAKDNASQLVFTHGVAQGILGTGWEYLPAGWVMDVSSSGAIMQLVVEGPASADMIVSFSWYEIDNTK